MWARSRDRSVIRRPLQTEKKECCERGCASPYLDVLRDSILPLASHFGVSTISIHFQHQMISGVLADLEPLHPVRQVFRALQKRWTPQQIRSLRLQFGDLHLVCHRLSQVWMSYHLIPRPRTYPCDHRNSFMAFFGALVEEPVTVDPGQLPAHPVTSPSLASHSATGCELSRQWHLPVVGLGSVPDIARGAGAGGCVQPMRRHVTSLLGGFQGWKRDL